MTSSIPLSRQSSWTIIFIQSILITSIICFSYFSIPNGLFVGWILCLMIFIFNKFYLLKHHNDGIHLVKCHQFEQAIPYFEKSLDFYTRNSWLDKYLHILLLSNSKTSIKEMALCNIAFCYGQVGNGKKAKEYYELTLQEFPESGLASVNLKLIDSAQKINQS